MLVSDGRITMAEGEWQEFAALSCAPWRPRTIAEFNAMCDLGAARHLADNTRGEGFMFALELEGIKFGEDGEANFPLDKRKLEYMRVHGIWPTQEQFEVFQQASGAQQPGPGGLTRVK
jgi:hypothetical protein